MSDPETLQEKPRSPIWRLIFGSVMLLVVLLISVGVAYWFTDVKNARVELEKLEAHLDETDPNWRLAEIQAHRREVPVAQNSARLVLAVARSIPKGWPQQSFYEKVDALPPPTERLSKEQSELLATRMAEIDPIAVGARKLADMPYGRHRLEISVSVIDTLLQDQQETRQVANLLKYHALNLAEKGDIDTALRTCRGIINCGRSLGDEPFVISQLIRIACVTIGLSTAERVLAQGQATEKELAALQDLLALEESHPTLRIGMRGERAVSHDVITKLLDGRINRAYMLSNLTGEKVPWWMQWFGPGVSRRDPVYNLRLMTRMVEVTKLPESDQNAEEKRIEADLKKLPGDARITRMLVPGMAKVGEACRRKTAQVRAMMTLVAVERYRLKHNKWPATLDDLRPKFLKAIPIDPYDGKVIRHVKTADGVIVYTLGPDVKDDGGKLTRKSPLSAGTDLGYQLWNLKERRQPARPKPPPAPEALPGQPGGPGQ